MLGEAVVLSVAALLSILFYIYVLEPLRLQRKASLPPGPPGHWLFGNAPPGPYAYRHYANLINEYGPVTSLRYGRRIVCIVGRYQAAVDILVKHSAETMDRPRFVAAHEILSGGLRVVLTGEGDRIKRLRRALHAFLQPKVAETYKKMQSKNARTYVLDCYREPKEHMDHARRYAATVVISMTYGKTTPTSYSDPEVETINRCLRRFGAALRPGAHLVDTYPFLRYIPGYTAQLQDFHQEELSFFQSQVANVKSHMRNGEAETSFVAHILREQQNLQLSDDEVAYLAGAMFGAGSDTTASSLSIVAMAAALFPDAQAKVQAQLDQVVGRDRAPTFDDEVNLPEATAFFLEASRWRPVASGGFAHRATKDIVWKDYVLPAGTEIVGNHLAISRDPEVYPDPETFNPQRWLDANGRLRDDLKFFTFGFGRRTCVGQHVADNSLFITTALTLWGFNVTQNASSPIDPDAFTDEALIFPKPFTVNFTPRIDGLVEILKEELV
ncbi:cytochrome P450 [Fomitopsis serialis]|uniref:cytochrome P450 n=1 Tax=Fomitopsis serialis TaxID=139415 RepID=UPI002008A1C0|nr:cytochrome P450 [Neoantrodia serialis]KAH9930251.1 cytochrome P450 [Neoantrodia serialis]